MSHTFYDSPEGSVPSFSIDVTHAFAWFFEADADGHIVGTARAQKSELPAIHRALGDYLEGETEEPAYDVCQLCHGARGGVPGTEHVISLAGLEVKVCDYCHAALSPKP